MEFTNTTSSTSKKGGPKVLGSGQLGLSPDLDTDPPNWQTLVVLETLAPERWVTGREVPSGRQTWQWKIYHVESSHMGVSINGGTPKLMVYKGKSH